MLRLVRGRVPVAKLLMSMAAALLLQTADARALGRSVPDLRALVRGSELIFHGEVVAIRYALSAPSAEGGLGLPHTFVTYRVERVIRGSIDAKSAREASGREGRTVTLRFLGGWRAEDQAVLHVSSVPRFDVGDVDVLFVRGNGVANCPLSGWINGRMRVIGGRLYTEEGQEILWTRDGRLGWGAEHDFEEVMTQTVGEETFELRRDDDRVEGEEAEHALVLEKGRAIQAASFLDRLAQRLGEPPRGSRSVKSANPRIPFDGPRAQPVPPVEGEVALGRRAMEEGR